MTTVLIGVLRVMRILLAPVTGVGCCRFTPTCSRYAEDALWHHGVLAGLTVAAWRLLRCHPGAPGGYDPVPLHVGGARHP